MVRLAKMSQNYMVLLKKDSLLSWERAHEIYSLAREDKSFERFGYGIRVPIGDFTDLREIAAKYQMEQHLYILYLTPKHREVPIHIDGIPNQKNAASLNWPLFNCDENSPSEWYEMVADPEYQIILGSYFLKNKDQAVCVHREAMHSAHRAPYLFRGELWHRGYNQSEGVRVILKWELLRESWFQTVQEFKNYGFITS